MHRRQVGVVHQDHRLILEGYLNRTPQGRIATEPSYKKLGLKPSGPQARLL